jgi:hypothetical protein
MLREARAGCDSVRDDLSMPVPMSQIDDDVAARSRAADEEISIGPLVERLGSVDDLSKDQAALATMTDTSPAGHRTGTSQASASSTML